MATIRQPEQERVVHTTIPVELVTGSVPEVELALRRALWSAPAPSLVVIEIGDHPTDGYTHIEVVKLEAKAFGAEYAARTVSKNFVVLEWEILDMALIVNRIMDEVEECGLERGW